ncbi:protein tyrosine phosphatase [Cellulomonas flavigena DSM 20109]|uniref:Protein tyrosine phosphatase n=1 Tax=Cellulomonas flavigena (strain ATCC 482 / DSM 20109 / BCRC 11376 / JCM 18109 / NBRC 3775 / NCIMB 8073 / NRS 134) TaxID=446466 RepID=D5UJD9_CELFN|nr:low molecular weight phosphatase family protein [Cellulomonas flavigena]ADG73662.1 protein tyrosine phosphatase [Cellulomonas flavigena DSM 20109]
MTSPQPPARILVVCTGNICRSPAVERLLAARLVGSDVEVTSAGTRAVVGHPVSDLMVPLVRGAGASADGFAARQLTADLVRDADLVIALTRGHRSAIVELVPAAVRRTFTLLELARLVAHVDPTVVHAAGSPGDRVRALPTLAAAVRHVAGQGDDDVEDPIGGNEAVYQASYDQMAPAVATIATALQGWSPAATA